MRMLSSVVSANSAASLFFPGRGQPPAATGLPDLWDVYFGQILPVLYTTLCIFLIFPNVSLSVTSVATLLLVLSLLSGSNTTDKSVVVYSILYIGNRAHYKVVSASFS
jgi:hypothetical protein